MPDPHLVKFKFPERGLDSGGYNAMNLSQRFERQRTCECFLWIRHGPGRRPSHCEVTIF